MSVRSNSRFAGIAVVGISFLISGCSPQKLSDVALPISDASESAGNPVSKPQVVSVAHSVDQVSPAIKANQLPPADADPQVVCRRFLEHLNRGNPDYFELLLTPAALNRVSSQKFQLPPVAEPEATVVLAEPKYNNNLEKLCYIDCNIAGPDDADNPENNMTWMLRKTASGWRVAGMLIQEVEPGRVNLISFESESDIAQIKSSLTAVILTPVSAE